MEKKPKAIKPAVKDVSELKFSDFLGTSHQYDHTKEDKWEAVGCTESDVEMVREKMLNIFKDPKNTKISEMVEKALALDIPAPWKALGFMKIGEGAVRGSLLSLIKDAPDEVPGPVLKGLLILALQHGGGI